MKQFKRIRNVLAAVLALVLMIPTTSYAKEYVVTQKMTEWNIYLYEHQDLINVYNELFDATDEDGNKLYSEEFVVGIIANVEHEGAPGVVEYYFSQCGQYGFALPSGGTKIKTIDDVNYLLNWTTSDDETLPGHALKGSCGVSSVQWSYGRRIKWLNKLKESMGKRTVVTQYDLTYADVTMMLEELDVNGYYYNKVMSAVGKNPTAADYAEALCDYYFIPAGADLNYSNTEKACKTRRETADRVWKIYTSKSERFYTMTLIDN